MPSRRFRLPLTFDSKRQTAALQRYIETQRPYAAYLPDNIDFVAKNNAFTREEFEKIYLTASFMVVAVGFFTALPLSLPVDPRQRMNCPKMNPSRVFTPEGQVSWGGSCMAYDIPIQLYQSLAVLILFFQPLQRRIPGRLSAHRNVYTRRRHPWF